METLKNEFIDNLFAIYGAEAFEDLRGKTFAEEYKFGNDSLDQDIQIFIKENNLTLTESEREELVELIYLHRF